MGKILIFIYSCLLIYCPGQAWCQDRKARAARDVRPPVYPSSPGAASKKSSAAPRPADVVLPPPPKPVTIVSPAPRTAVSKPAPVIPSAPPAPVFTPADGQQFSSGFSSGIQSSQGRSRELDEQISGLSEQKAEQEAGLKKAAQNSFLKALEREKEKEKNNAGACGSGGDYEIVLFDDSLLTLKYKLVSLDSRSSTYTNTSGLEIPFCGYYYKAVCTIVNKKGKRLGLKGYIHGSPGLESKRHISVHGKTGQDFGFDKDPATYWNKFYISWNSVLPLTEHTETGYFWTEVRAERPAWEFTYFVLQ